jgi:hypothetical protein
MQQTDRTTKVLLLLIAIALWGLLLKSVFAPTPSEAQIQTTRQTNQIVNPVHVIIDSVSARDSRGNRTTLLLQDVRLNMAAGK